MSMTAEDLDIADFVLDGFREAFEKDVILGVQTALGMEHLRVSFTYSAGSVVVGMYILLPGPSTEYNLNSLASTLKNTPGRSLLRSKYGAVSVSEGSVAVLRLQAIESQSGPQTGEVRTAGSPAVADSGVSTRTLSGPAVILFTAAFKSLDGANKDWIKELFEKSVSSVLPSEASVYCYPRPLGDPSQRDAAVVLEVEIDLRKVAEKQEELERLLNVLMKHPASLFTDEFLKTFGVPDIAVTGLLETPPNRPTDLVRTRVVVLANMSFAWEEGKALTSELQAFETTITDAVTMVLLDVSATSEQKSPAVEVRVSGLLLRTEVGLLGMRIAIGFPTSGEQHSYLDMAKALASALWADNALSRQLATQATYLASGYAGLVDEPQVQTWPLSRPLGMELGLLPSVERSSVSSGIFGNGNQKAAATVSFSLEFPELDMTQLHQGDGIEDLKLDVAMAMVRISRSLSARTRFVNIHPGSVVVTGSTALESGDSASTLFLHLLRAEKGGGELGKSVFDTWGPVSVRSVRVTKGTEPEGDFQILTSGEVVEYGQTERKGDSQPSPPSSVDWWEAVLLALVGALVVALVGIAIYAVAKQKYRAKTFAINGGSGAEELGRSAKPPSISGPGNRSQSLKQNAGVCKQAANTNPTTELLSRAATGHRSAMNLNDTSCWSEFDVSRATTAAVPLPRSAFVNGVHGTGMAGIGSIGQRPVQQRQLPRMNMSPIKGGGLVLHSADNSVLHGSPFPDSSPVDACEPLPPGAPEAHYFPQLRPTAAAGYHSSVVDHVHRPDSIQKHAPNSRNLPTALGANSRPMKPIPPAGLPSHDKPWRPTSEFRTHSNPAAADDDGDLLSTLRAKYGCSSKGSRK